MIIMPREISNFRSFNEANIRDNRGLDREYIDDIQDRETSDARGKLQRGEVNFGRFGMLLSQVVRIQGGELRGLTPVWHDYQKKTEVEELARHIIEDRYGRIIDSLNIEMDIALVDPNELSDMKGSSEMLDSPQELPEYEETDDEDLKADADKRKIANIITQGAAKHAHRLIHIYRDAIDSFNPRLFGLLDELIKTNEVREWTIPEGPGKSGLFRGGMIGYTKTEFESKEDEDNFKDITSDVNIEDIITDDSFNDDGAFDEWNGRIKVTARAIDLVVLLHESVKGIYEVLATPSIPDTDEQRARDVLANTDTLDDEFIDLRYGPAIRRDLLAWVNSNDKIDQIEDGFEYVWGAMISVTPSSEFLELFYDAIIGKTGRADNWLDNLLDDLIEEEETYRRELAEYEQDMERWERQQSTSGDTTSSDISDEIDYSTLTKKQLSDIRDQALDDGDFDTLRKISQYI